MNTPTDTPDELASDAPDAITFDELAEYFTELTDGYHCPFCKGESFGLATPTPMDITSALPSIPLMSDKRRFGKRLPLVAILCETCGHLSVFRAELVIDRIRQRRERMVP